MLKSETRLDSAKTRRDSYGEEAQLAVTPSTATRQAPHSRSSPLPPLDPPPQNNGIPTPAIIANDLTRTTSPDPRGGKCRRVQVKREIAMTQLGELKRMRGDGRDKVT